MGTKVAKKTVTKKTVTKKVVTKKPVKATVVKNATDDEIAFEKLIKSNDEFKKVVQHTGKPKVYAVFLAGVKRGKSAR